MTAVYQLEPAEDAPIMMLEPSGVYERLIVCTRAIPALAEESELTLLASGTIMTVRHLELREQLIRGVAAFVLSEWPRGPVYFSSDVVDAIVVAKLTGLARSAASWRVERAHGRVS